MKKAFQIIFISAALMLSAYILTLQRSEITALHIKIDTLKAENIRLIESMFVADTIKVYVVKGIVKEGGGK